jgi:hypothetical protein
MTRQFHERRWKIEIRKKNGIAKERNRKKTYLDRGVPPFLGNPNVGVKPKREILQIVGFSVFSK